MSILGDIINIRGALQQQAQNKQLFPLQLGQSQAQLQMLQQQLPQVQALLDSINGGGQQPPAQPPSGLLPQPQTTQSPSGPVTSSPLSSDDQAQPQTSALTSGLLPGAIHAINAAQPGGGLLQQPQSPGGLFAPPGAQPQQPQSGPDPWRLIDVGTRLQGMMLPQWQNEGKALVARGQAMLANMPQYVTQKGVAGNVLTQDQYLIDHASTPQQRQAALTKYQTDAGQLRISNNTGAVTAVGIPMPNFSTSNAQTGTLTTQNGQTLLPGATQTRAALAQAQATGEEAGKAPYDMVTVKDQQGNAYLVPKSSLLSPQTPGSTQPPGTSGPALSEIGPQTEHALAGRGQQAATYVTQLQDAADAATTSNYALDNVVSAARGATLGPGAPAREAVLKGFTALAQAVNPSFKPPTELSSYQELDKYGNQLGFATARTLGSREAAQIVQLAIASNPNKTLTPQSFGFIASSMKAMNNYVIAKNQAIQGAEQRTPGSAQQASSIWTSNVSPQAWDLALDPGIAATIAPKLGADKISASLPFMSSSDAVAAFRNIPASLRAAVLAKLPPEAKQELAAGLRQ